MKNSKTKCSQMNKYMIFFEEKSGPFLQALQFCISIGSFITPLMNKPFLISCPLQSTHNNYNNLFNISAGNLSDLAQSYSNISLNKNIINSSDGTFLLNDQIFLGENTSYDLTELKSQNFDTNLKPITEDCVVNSLISIPYAIEGFLGTCGSMCLIILYLFMRQKQKSLNSKKVDTNEYNSNEMIYSRNSVRKVFYILTGSVLLGSFFGIEIANFQILATFTRYLNKDISGNSFYRIKHI